MLECQESIPFHIDIIFQASVKFSPFSRYMPLIVFVKFQERSRKRSVVYLKVETQENNSLSGKTVAKGQVRKM